MSEVLVVTSKVKKYIKENGDCNTSGETIEVLSEAVRKLCEKGYESAKADGRKTVMARDIVVEHL
jgi:histone H3/H4